MKISILFITMLAASPSSFALTELIENTSNGGTYIDTINEVARINFNSDYRNPRIKPTYACGKLKIVKREDTNGKTVTDRVAEKEQTCDSLKSSVKSFIDCEEVPVMMMTVNDPKTCGPSDGPCEKMPTPLPSTQDVRLKNIKEDIKKCSPEHELLVITDAKGKRAAISSLKDKQQCGHNFARKTIDTGSTLWDSEKRPEYKINVGHTPGFFIGDHTHYFFDFSKEQWCIHFKPSDPMRKPVCSAKLNGMTRSIGFLFGKEQKTKGVVKLEIKDGKPVATIGHPVSDEYKKSPDLDTTKPVMQVSITNDESKGRRSVFELKEANGTTLSRMDVTPTFALGSRLSTAGACDSSSCLNVPPEVSGPQGSSLYCKQNGESLPLEKSTQGLCYSCNGVTPGFCDQSTTLIQKNGPAVAKDEFNRKQMLFSEVLGQINSCKTADSVPESSTPVEN
jgi:hypothetical protein